MNHAIAVSSFFRHAPLVLTPAQYSHFLAVARRQARRNDEAEDLLHNALLAAINAGRRDLDDPGSQAWLAGVIRNLAAMDARSAARRRTREAALIPHENATAPPADELDAWLRSIGQLPRAARSVAVLALSGLNRDEIACVLQLSDTALRQRLTTVRRAWYRLAARPTDPPRLQSTYRTQLDLGLLREALLSVIRRRGGIGTHDPDGHLMVIEQRSQSRAARQRKKKRQEKS